MSSKDRKADREARLAALREKLANTDIGGGGGKGWMRLEEGSNLVRIMPPVHEMEYFFQTVGQHWISNDKKFYCPKFTSEGKLPCPLCDMVDDLYKAGDKASKELASKLRVSKKYWINVIDRNDEDAGPKILQANTAIFTGIVSLINDPEYADIDDPDEGLDIVIEKTKTGGKAMDVEYQVLPRRKSSPLASKVVGGKLTNDPDDDLIEEWMEKASDLTYVEVGDDPEQDKDLADGHAVYVLPYKRIQREFELDGAEEDDEDDIEEVMATPVPKRGAAREEVETRIARRSARK